MKNTMRKLSALLAIVLVFSLFAAMAVTVSAEDEPTPGSAEAPITPDYFDIPGSFDTLSIEAGATLYYDLYRIGGTIISINDADASVTANEVTYDAVDGVVTFDAPASMSPFMPTTLAITNKGTEAKSFTVNFALPVGAMQNPEVIEELGEIEASLAEGDDDGYYYSWTATEDGVLSAIIISFTEGTEVDLNLTNNTTYAMKNSSDADVEGFISIEVSAGDVVIIQPVVYPDMTTWIAPASDVKFALTFVPAETEDSSVDSSEDSSEDSSADSSEDSVVNSSEASVSTPDDNTANTGDAGVAVFALLSVISLAGIVVVKKTK